MQVIIIGTGYVGLTTAVSLAYLGHTVTAIDKDAQKIALLKRGESPIHEPGIAELLARAAPRLMFAETLPEEPRPDVVLIAVGTPPKANGEANIGYVEAAAREVAEALPAGQPCTFVVKSTVPIGTNRRVIHIVERTLAGRGVSVPVAFASNPEFLREGMALHDTFFPDRIVVGADEPRAIAAVSQLYRPLLEQTFIPPSFLPRPEGQPLPSLLTTDLVSAEMIKYAANAFLALKISYINEIAGLCEKVGADVTEVARGIGLDGRIGKRFLNAGLGWGGSCFPKDTLALLAVAADYGYTMPIIHASREVNARQRQVIVEKLQTHLKVLRGRTIGVLGLAFKPQTDDVRESPTMEIIHTLIERGAHVHVHDPVAMPNAQRELAGLDMEFKATPEAVAEGADALVLATEWECYAQLDLPRLAQVMKQPILVDGRNFLPPDAVRAAGFVYAGVGR